MVAKRKRVPEIPLKDDTSPLAGAEKKIRKKTNHNIFVLLLVNTYSSMVIFVTQLITLESIISVGLSVGLTIYIYNKTEDDESTGFFDGSAMDWVLLSFIVVTPISAAARMAFTRREQALVQISILRSTFISIYAAHAVWNWGWNPDKTTGRDLSPLNWVDHTDETCSEMFLICSDLTRFLTLPCSSRARHKITEHGRVEAEELDRVGSQLKMSIVSRFGKLARLCEIVKGEGLPPNEATRIRQWERMAFLAVEQLFVIKAYRTPQGLRSFARLFSTLMPPFYAPYYAQLAHDLNSLGVAITFSVLTSVALTTLFEVVHRMEDPFESTSYLDGVETKSELVDKFRPDLLTLRKYWFPEAAPFKLIV